MFLVLSVVIVFFKFVSHQLCKTEDLHLQIRMAGMTMMEILAKITHNKQERGVTNTLS